MYFINTFIDGIAGHKNKISKIWDGFNQAENLNINWCIEINIIKCDIHITAEVTNKGQTGVEMEALTAVSISCLTIYDMLKGIDRDATISKIQLIRKSGGKSGKWIRNES